MTDAQRSMLCLITWGFDIIAIIILIRSFYKIRKAEKLMNKSFERAHNYRSRYDHVNWRG